MKSTKSMCRQLCFRSYLLAPFAFGAHLLAFSIRLRIAFYLSRRDNTLFPEVHSLRNRVRVPVTLCSPQQVQIALTLSQILTFSHVRSSLCLVGFPPGHSVFSHSAEFPNKINAHLNASVERASFGSSIALEAKSCCWRT